MALRDIFDSIRASLLHKKQQPPWQAGEFDEAEKLKKTQSYHEEPSQNAQIFVGRDIQQITLH